MELLQKVHSLSCFSLEPKCSRLVHFCFSKIIGANSPGRQVSTSSMMRSTAFTSTVPIGGLRLNKFVRRLHDMLVAEQDRGVVEWRKGLLVLHSTDAFAKKILPKYFNTKNFKTFRRQLNYYGFVHVRSFSTTGQATTALWVNQDLAKRSGADSSNISSVLLLKRVDPCPEAKTAEGRRVRKEEAAHTVECDIGVDPKNIQMDHLKFIARTETPKTNRESSLSSYSHETDPHGSISSGISSFSSSEVAQGVMEDMTVSSEVSSNSSDSLEKGSRSPSKNQKIPRSTSLLQLYKSDPNDVAKLLLKLAHPKSAVAHKSTFRNNQMHIYT